MVVLVAGVAGMKVLASMKRPPAKAHASEQAIRVEAIRVAAEDVPVVITGYGTVRALNTVAIAPEVSGRVTEIHPRLEVGEVIPSGETLLVIDPRTYEAMVADAQAMVNQLESTVKRLSVQSKLDRERLATLERTRDLARAEFERLKNLFENDQVGTQAAVESTEQAYNGAIDQVDRMIQALELYPVQIAEAKSGLAAAEARLEQSRLSLERTRIVAPFNARVKSHQVELGQLVAPGAPVVTLADDSVLEISVPLDSREAQRWLGFDGQRAAEDSAWFSGLEPVTCAIQWTDDDGHVWNGTLHRVEQFDEQTRTVTVAVRIAAENALSGDADRLPLVEGMFCQVGIPGKTMPSVFRLPRSAVSFKNTVYAARDGRLCTVAVDLVRDQGDEAFVAGGLSEGDLVVTTRLVDPLENALLDVEVWGAKEESEG